MRKTNLMKMKIFKLKFKIRASVFVLMCIALFYYKFQNTFARVGWGMMMIKFPEKLKLSTALHIGILCAQSNENMQLRIFVAVN